ncbi:MAG: peroxiredoxin [Granulosicoccus sp.]
MLKQGDKIPDITVMQVTADGPKNVSLTDYCKGRKVVFFAIPGPFTPTCSESHVPGFLQHDAAIRSKGVAAVACLSTADFFVMDAWGKSLDVGDRIDMLADGNHEFTRAAGMTLDLSAGGLGERSQRYAMIVDDGVISHVAVESNPSEATTSAADAILQKL